MTRDTRRGVRTIVYAIVTLAATAALGWIIYQGDAITVRHVAYGLLGIVGLGSFGYVAENVTQRVSFRVGPGGINGEIGQ